MEEFLNSMEKLVVCDECDNLFKPEECSVVWGIREEGGEYSFEPQRILCNSCSEPENDDESSDEDDEGVEYHG